MRFLFVIAILCCATPVYAGVLDVQEIKSKNGVKAWLVEDHTVPVVSIRFMFKGAGAVNDPEDKQGLSQILSNTLDEGAGDLDSKAFQEKLNDHSISLGFQSSRDDFGGAVKTLTKYRGEALDLLALALTSPRFETDAVSRMVESNLVRIRSSMTDPEWMNARLSNALIYKGHPYALNTGGTLSSLKKITPDDLRQKFKTQLAQDNLMITVAGDMTAAEVSSMIDKVFGQLPETAQVKKLDDFKFSDATETYLYKQDIPQTVISMMIPGISHADPEYHAAEVMGFVLGSSGFGSRLTEEIREKRGLTYGIYSGLNELEHSAVLSVGTATRNDKAQEVIQLTKDVMIGMRDTQISDKELADAKSYLIGSVALQMTSTDRISAILMGLLSENLPADYMERRAQAIENLTTEDILKVSKRILKPENLKIILVGNPKIGDSYKPVLSMPNVE